ncbi:MAG: hypothetical protein P8Q29_00930 [Tateyamaria sp.]|nr:hypothetical protein [Tateyamaria sp.]
MQKTIVPHGTAKRAIEVYLCFLEMNSVRSETNGPVYYERIIE